jgi:molecular chaperone HscA
VEQMLLDSIDHAEDDIHRRLLVEQQVEARRVLMDARKQLEQNGDLLSAQERADFEERVGELEVLVEKATDHHELKTAIESLDQHARPFVERIMNRAISTAAVGHSMEDF